MTISVLKIVPSLTQNPISKSSWIHILGLISLIIKVSWFSSLESGATTEDSEAASPTRPATEGGAENESAKGAGDGEEQAEEEDSEEEEEEGEADGKEEKEGLLS